VDGKLKQIDVGSNEVWGVNRAENIFRRAKDGSGKWTNVPGKLKHVSSGPTGKVWGVNTNNDIYTLKADGNWRQIDGKLKQIDVGPNEVWGVNANDDIFTRPNDGSGAWKNIPGKLKHVSVSRDKIVGVNAQDNIFTCQQPCTGNWENIDGKLKQIDATSGADQVEIVGVNSSDDIFKRVKGSMCRQANTGFNDEGRGNAVYLDRHDVKCNDDEAISQVRLIRSGSRYRYDYTCCKLPNGGGDCKDANTGFNSEGNGNAVFLDRHDIKCGTGSALTRFQLARSGGGNYRYNYRCCGGSDATKTCRETNTPYNDDGKGNAVYLDRHDLKCGEGEYLSQLRLVRNPANQRQYRYNYTCCK
jgi:hypothetical protein